MADETTILTQPPQQEDPPLKRTWNWIRSNNSRFSRTFEEFEADMADEAKRRSTHKWISDNNAAFQKDYDSFSSDMGFKKKNESELFNSPTSSQTSAEPTAIASTALPSTPQPGPEESVLSKNFDPDLARLAQIDPSQIGKIQTPEQARFDFDQKNKQESDASNFITEVDKKQRPEMHMEKNPLITGGKSLWNVLANQLPSSMASVASMAVPEQVKDYRNLVKRDDKQLEADAIKMKKSLLEYAQQQQGESTELTSDLVQSVDQVNGDPINALNYVFNAAGQATGQIPLSVATGGASSVMQEVGSVYLESIKRIADDKGISVNDVIDQDLDEPAFALTYGVVAGLLDRVGAGKVMGSITKPMLKKAIQDRAKTIATSGGWESATEYVQTWMEQIGAEHGGGQSFTEALTKVANSNAKRKERVEGFVQGLIGGTTLSAGGEVISNIERKANETQTPTGEKTVEQPTDEKTVEEVITPKATSGTDTGNVVLADSGPDAGGLEQGDKAPGTERQDSGKKGKATRKESTPTPVSTESTDADKKITEFAQRILSGEVIKGGDDLKFYQKNKDAVDEEMNRVAFEKKVERESKEEKPLEHEVLSKDYSDELTEEEKQFTKERGGGINKQVVPSRMIFKKPLLPEWKEFSLKEKGPLSQAISDGGGKVESVSVDDIIPTDPLQKKHQIREKPDLKNLPQLLRRKDGSVVVIDGHHRIAEQILGGATSIKATVIDEQIVTKPTSDEDTSKQSGKVESVENVPENQKEEDLQAQGAKVETKSQEQFPVKEDDPHQSYIDDVAPRIGKEPLNKNALRKIAEQYGIDNDNHIKELTEVAIVDRAREIATQEGAYEKLVEFYNNQPTLSHRTSESIAKQQYSTPVPISYIAGKYINADEVKKILEPSAGNGMLTITADPANVTVNEIDDFRGSNLSRQGFAKILKQDGTQPLGLDKQFDAVITNPPFGGTDTEYIDGFKFNETAQIMAVRALHAMKDTGKGAIIIGGNNKYDDEGRLSGRDRLFFNYLYNRYNVEDVIDISGDLYRKQGASFPIRLILVNGRKATPEGVAPLKDKFGPVINSFEDLKPRVEKLFTSPNITPDENLQSTELVGGVTTTPDRPGSRRSSKQNSDVNTQGAPAKQVPDVGGEVNTGGTETSLPGVGPSGVTESPGGGLDGDSGLDTGQPGISQATVEQGQQQQPGGETALDQGPAAVVSRNEPGTDRKVVEGAISERSGSINYEPYSKGKTMNVKIPSSMAQEMHDAMNALKNEVGDIDDYVQKKLAYKSKKALHDAFGAEQIDGVAMAIKQIESGKALIIGDQTGIGKGRQAAAIVRYGNVHGLKPIFLSEKPNLFGAIYRDLKSIGHGHIKPFIVNNIGDKFNGVRDKDDGGKVMHKAYPSGHKEHLGVLKSMRIPDEAQIVLATYSQFGNPKFTDKINFIKAVAQGNIVILDESHNSSGADSNTGAVFQQVVPSAKGVVFLSGTYAKRPDNMPIYALKTSMKEANMTTDQLIEAVQSGGVALQEIVSGQLASAGELIRRQRSLEDVTVINEVLEDQAEDHIKSADTITDLVREIIRFQSKFVKPRISKMDKSAKDKGEIVKLTGGTNQAGVDNAPYFSRVFNIIDQMLYSLKAKSVADWAIKQLKAGKKPFVAIRGTMESTLSDLIENGDVEYGDQIDPDFSYVMSKGLKSVMRYTVKDPSGSSEVFTFTPEELGPGGSSEFYRIEQKIKASVSGLSLSPIDEVVQTIEKAGYKVAEITGRQSKLILTSGQKKRGVLDRKKREPVDEAYRKYNSGEYDVIVVNSSGSTGEDAHSDAKFKDKRPRTMVVLQPELNINTLVQILGRINRTGQIHQPEYAFLNSVIPAEQRLMMMTMKKLKSLDANTTSNQKQSKGVLDVPEFFNKYGDEIVIEYLQENPEVIEMIGDPLKMLGKEDDAPIKSEDAALRVSGRVAILPVKEQEKFYTEIADRYQRQIEYLNDAGINDLEVTALPLRAKTVKEKVTIVGKGGKSAFGEDTLLEEVEVDVLKKPMTQAEIDKSIKDLSGDDPEKHSGELFSQLQAYEEKATATFRANYEEDLAKALANLDAMIADPKNEFTDEEVTESREAVKSAQELKFNKKVKDEHFRIEYVKSLFRFFRPGRPVRVPTSFSKSKDNLFFSDGIFLGFEINLTKAKPFLPSNIRLRFAVNDSRAQIPIPASKRLEVNDIREYSSQIGPQAVERIKNWDALKKSKGREVRLIATGNVLQGLGKYSDGKIIKYTTDKGFIKTGILLPDGFKEREGNATTNVSVPASRAVQIIKDSARYSDFFTADGNVKIRNEGAERYTMRVPRSKMVGGKYYLDEDILDLVDGNNFNSVGGDMEATFPGSRLSMVLDVLQNKFSSSIDLSQKAFEKALADKTIEMTKRSGETFEPVAQASLFPWMATTGIKKKPVNQVAEDALRKEIEFHNKKAEERYRDAAGPSPSSNEGHWKNIKDSFSHMITGFTSHFRHINPKQFPRETAILRMFETVNKSTAENAKQYLRGLVEPLTKEQFDIFTRRIVLEDLRGGIDKKLEDQDNLPFGFTSMKELDREIQKYTDLMAKEPAAQEAYDQRQNYMNNLYDALVDRGILFADEDRGTYYHRRVLEYLEEEENQRVIHGKRLSKAYKDWRRARTGTKGKDYSTNFMESEYRVVAEGLYEIEKQKILGELMGPYESALKTLKGKFNKQFQLTIEVLEDQYGKGSAEVQAYKANKRSMMRRFVDDNKPEGFTWYQPTPGNAIFVRKLVSQDQIEKEVERAALTDQSGIGTALQVIENIIDMADPMVLVGQKRKEYMVPQELANQLEDMGTTKPLDPNLLTEITGAWKVYVLLNPNRFLKYNLNNLFGDIDGTLAADPTIFKMARRAWKELKTFKQTGETTPDLNAAIRQNVVDSGWEISELSDINNANFAQFFSDQSRPDLQDVFGRKLYRDSIEVLRTSPGKIWNWYWDKVKGWTRIRENTLRYASYLRAKERIDNNEKIYWASNPEEIDGITSAEMKAGKLAREVLGDYGNISITGQRIRKYMIPFYSWMEVNMGRYYRLFRNASSPRVQARVGAALAARGITAITFRMMYAYALMGAFTALIEAWNWFRFPEETEKMRRANTRGMQLILGTTDEGKVVTLPIVGAFYDALDFFGLPDMKDDLALIFSGNAPTKGALGAAKTFAITPYTKLVQAVNPFGKMAYELITGDQLFPDPMNPRPIYDYGEYFAQFLSLQDEYRALTGTPTRSPYFFGHFRNLVVKEIDPDELSYYMAKRIVDAHNESKFQVKQDAKSVALYRYSLAIRFGKTDEALRWMNEYYANGGTVGGLNQSLRGKNPLTRLNGQEEQDVKNLIADPAYQATTQFGKTLTAKEVKIFRDAIDYYSNTYDPIKIPDQLKFRQ